jgi:hypothetical protein
MAGFSPIVPGVTTGATAASELNGLGSDNTISFKFVTAIASVESEVIFFETGTLVYSILEDSFYKYNGATWDVFANLPTFSNLGNMATQDANAVAITGGSIAVSVLDLLGGGLEDNNVTTPVKLGSATDTSLNTVKKNLIGGINEVHALAALHTSGVTGTMPTTTNNNDGTVTIGSCNVVLYDNASYSGDLKQYSVAGETLTFVDGAQEYIAIKYNNGTPIVYKETSVGVLTGSNNATVAVVWRVGDNCHILTLGANADGLPNRISGSILLTDLYRLYDGGLVPSESATPNPRTIKVAAGVIFAGISPVSLAAFDSSVDLFTIASHSAGAWNYGNVLVYGNSQYDNGTNLVTLTDEYYTNVWLYRSVGDIKQVFCVYGDGQYQTVSSAHYALPRTDLPAVISGHCFLVGKVIVKKGDSSGIVDNYTQISISGLPIIPHNDALNIQGGAFGDNYHLTASEYIEVGALRTIAKKTANYQMTTADSTILSDASARAITINLPAAASCYNAVTKRGKVVMIKKIDHTNNYVHVTGDATIDGDSEAVLVSMDVAIALQCFSDGWYIV